MALVSSQGSARRHSEHGRNAATPTTHLRREIIDAMTLADVDWLVDNEMLPSIVRDVVHDAQSELVEEWTAIERGHGKAAKFSTSAEVKHLSASKLASYLPQSPAWCPAHHLVSWRTAALACSSDRSSDFLKLFLSFPRRVQLTLTMQAGIAV